MSSPDRPDEDPFAGLPPELRAMLEQLGGPEGLAELQSRFSSLLGGGGMPDLGAMGGLFGGPVPTGPVDWELATRVALQLAADGDRGPAGDERQRAEDALQLAEHWLDDTPLPAPPDAGQLVVGSRQTWVNAAITALRPLVEPVAKASTDAMVALASEQLGELDLEEGLPELPGLEGLALPPGFDQLLGQLSGGDLGSMLRPAGAMMAGLQAGQVVGQLARQLLGQYELGLPTAPRPEAHHLAVNVAEAFDGYGLDATEVALVLVLHEAAHRRLYHAVPWLEAHVQSLVARFAAGTTVDQTRLQELQEELMVGVDPEDPESLRAAMERAARFRMTPTDEQLRVLERLQGVICLVGAWARHEVVRAVEGRLPSVDRIAEVLRRRRASRGAGEALLADLLGLDLKPEDETTGERFVAAVEHALGPAGLRRALDHPENLPDTEELADPARWLARLDDVDVPDDLSALFADAGEAPVEASAAERSAGLLGEPERPGEGDDTHGMTDDANGTTDDAPGDGDDPDTGAGNDPDSDRDA